MADAIPVAISRDRAATSAIVRISIAARAVAAWMLSEISSVAFAV
jgi:hypothetical protein